jgi:26S proteasome regulatory subunit N6
LDAFSGIPNSSKLQIELCKELISWCIEEKRSFLKQTLEAKLVSQYLDAREYTDSLSLISTLLKELKRLDDKMMLVEVHLLESKAYFALKNLSKSRVR